MQINQSFQTANGSTSLSLVNDNVSMSHQVNTGLGRVKVTTEEIPGGDIKITISKHNEGGKATRVITLKAETFRTIDDGTDEVAIDGTGEDLGFPMAESAN